MNQLENVTSAGPIDVNIQTKPDVRPSGWRRAAAAFGVFLLLATIHTWPLATNPAHLSRNDNGDALLNTWAIAWVAHQLPRDPVHLFDANIFYPERHTLGYSEAMVVQGVMAMPIIAAGGSAVLAYNLVLLAGFTLTGWAFCLLLYRWTGSWAAGYCGGSLAAFNSHVLVRLPHLQTQHVEFVAIMLFALDRLITVRRTRDSFLLGLSFALQALSSIYLMVFSTWMLLFAVVGRAGEWMRNQTANVLRLLATAGATATLLLAPYLLAYYETHLLTGFERPIEDGSVMAGSWVDYLSTGSRLHYSLWSAEFFPQAMSASFPGILAIALATVALASRESQRDRRVVMCLAIAVGCAAVSIVPRTAAYPTLYRIIPLFRIVRVQAHLEQIVLLAIAVIAGFGVAALQRHWPAQAGWPIAAAALCVAINAEALRAPLAYTGFSEIPPVYNTLASAPDAVVVEMPFYPPPQWHQSAEYMLYSTRHWRPILNGYSGFRPGSYQDTYAALQNFPDVTSLSALRSRGVTHVVVHRQAFIDLTGPERFTDIAKYASLQPITDNGDIYLYRIR